MIHEAETPMTLTKLTDTCVYIYMIHEIAPSVVAWWMKREPHSSPIAGSFSENS